MSLIQREGSGVINSVHQLTMQMPYVQRNACFSLPSAKDSMGTNTNPNGPRSYTLYTLRTISILVDLVKYKEVAKQHPVPKRDQKHFLLWSIAAEGLLPPGPISSLLNKGRKWLHPSISLWTHESVLWNLGSLGVSVYSSRLLPQGEKGTDKQ